MNFKSLIRHLSILTLALWSAAASAAPLDKSAMSKIDEAINVHYLSTNFDKAEGLLLGTLKACGERCSASVKARAWMYIGIVRGAGKQDSDGAMAAFVEALGIDPNAQLDKDLSTEELQALFAAAKGGTGPAEPTEEAVPLEEATPAPAVEAATVAGTMECTPDVAEVESRRPIPISCKTPEPASRVVVFYKPFGANKWTQLQLGKSGDNFVGTIPCAATAMAGTLSWYGKAMNGVGKPVDTSLTESDPHAIEIVQSTAVPPPSLPGKPPPARCPDPADCPEDMRGTPACPGTEKATKGGGGGWGDSCKGNGDCGEGTYCNDGTCESPPSCETDAECSGGTCEEFLCHYPDSGDEDDEDDEGGGSSKDPKWLFGLNIGLDMPMMEGQGVCNPLITGTSYQCFIAKELPYSATTTAANGMPSINHNPASMSPQYTPQRSGLIKSGLVPSTTRILASVEHPLTDKISVEGRVGVAFTFSTSPFSGMADRLHLSAHAKYWFTGMGKGLRLFAIAGAGLGRVDGKKGVLVDDFENDGSIWFTQYRESAYCPTAAEGYCRLPVDAYKKFGPGFLSAGLGGYWNLGGHGPVLQLAGQIMLPASGFVLQPMGGWVVGF